MDGSSTPAEDGGSDVYQQELAARAARHGFGYVDRKRRGRAAAGRCRVPVERYFVAGRKGKMTLREAGAPAASHARTSIVYVAS